MSLSKAVSFFKKVIKWSKIYLTRYSNYFFDYRSPRDSFKHLNNPAVVYHGSRSIQKLVFIRNRQFLQKVFVNNFQAIFKFRNELKAQKIFCSYKWFIPWTKRGLKSFTVPFYPLGSSLDKIGPLLLRSEQLRVAGRVLEVILDLYLAGYAHRDMKACNFLLVGDQIKLIDYEHLLKYPENKKGIFSNHYDITAKGLPESINCDRISFSSKESDSVSSILDVSLQEAFGELRNILFRELIISSSGFHNFRHHMRRKENSIYSSFNLNRFHVKPEKARRNTSIRLNQFGISEKTIKGKKILNLGSCTGAINFSIQEFNPRKSVGIEFDIEKVEISKKISGFCDITNIDFIRGDLDIMSIEEIGKNYDVVFCLAVEEHVKYPSRLFEILGKVCKGTLFYEGTAKEFPLENIKVKDTTSKLTEAGFKSIEYLGTCTDDSNPELNIRPLFRAHK